MEIVACKLIESRFHNSGFFFIMTKNDKCYWVAITANLLIRVNCKCIKAQIRTSLLFYWGYKFWSVFKKLEYSNFSDNYVWKCSQCLIDYCIIVTFVEVRPSILYKATFYLLCVIQSYSTLAWHHTNSGISDT